jgi:hypothetical protein
VLQKQASKETARLGRRTALRAGLALGAASAGSLAGTPVRAAPDRLSPAAQAAWQTQHLEVEQTPMNPVSITSAGSGPAQRGDWFFIDGPIYAVGDVGGTQIGQYQCFGAWTHAATETGAPDQRLTSVRYDLFGQGLIFGLINEGGIDQPSLVGAVQGGTDQFTGALGTFRQIGQAAGVAPGQVIVRSVLDLILPSTGG